MLTYHNFGLRNNFASNPAKLQTSLLYCAACGAANHWVLLSHPNDEHVKFSFSLSLKVLDSTCFWFSYGHARCNCSTFGNWLLLPPIWTPSWHNWWQRRHLPSFNDASVDVHNHLRNQLLTWNMGNKQRNATPIHNNSHWRCLCRYFWQQTRWCFFKWDWRGRLAFKTFQSWKLWIII